jgi:hypothetical protein
MLTIAIAIVFAAGAAAQTHPNFSGVWAGPEQVTVRIEHNADRVALTLRAVRGTNTEQQNMQFTIGQESKNEIHGSPATSRAEWDGGALVIRSVAAVANKELKLQFHLSLSADGNTLTLRERSQYGPEPERDETRVFQRRPADSWAPDAPPAPAEAVYKNIQILKGVPSPRLRGVMLNLTKWLGVECAHCHVMGAFEKDDKPAKERAREMFRMVRAVGSDWFKGSNPVTCWTCHRGSPKPQSLPAQ